MESVFAAMRDRAFHCISRWVTHHSADGPRADPVPPTTAAAVPDMLVTEGSAGDSAGSDTLAGVDEDTGKAGDAGKIHVQRFAGDGRTVVECVESLDDYETVTRGFS
ncbi:MAG: hypothetical protein SGCHY_003498 [Lobulomycetales sp.]